MRPRTLLGNDVQSESSTPARAGNHDTYERVRRTLDEALAELQLPRLVEREDSSGQVKLHARPLAR